MEKTNPLRRKLFGLLCALLLCLGGLPVTAQNCPNFQWSDFTTTLVQPNKDCNKPGIATIRYSNNIVGVDEVHYQFGSGSSGPWFYETDAAAPGATVKAEVPASMDGKYLYVRITTKCGTNTRSDWWGMGSINSQNSETIQLNITTTPTGNGVGSSGGVQAYLTGPSGFTEATFKLYNSADLNTPISTQRSTRPYEGVTFFNLSKGDYVVKADAKPACTPPTTASNWKTDHFELSAGATVGTFNLITTPIHARGNCPGGVKVEVSKVSGVQNIEYKVFNQNDENTPLDTYTASYPNFTHTFTGLPGSQAYAVTATEKTGNSTMRNTFYLYINNYGVEPRVVHGTLPGVNEGVVDLVVNGTSVACPVKYTITRTDGVAFTPIVKNNVTEETTRVEGLPKGNYKVTAEYGGLTQTNTFTISEGTMGYLSTRSYTQAQGLCEPSGGVQWYIYSGLNYNQRKVRVTNNATGALVREFKLAAGQTDFETKNLFPGEYKLTVRDENANTEISTVFTISSKVNPESDLSVDYYNTTTDYCGAQTMTRIPVKYTGTGGIENAPNLQAYLNGATYEIYKSDGKTFVYSGVMPTLTGNAASYIETPEIDSYYTLRIKPTCGYPVQNYTLYGGRGYKFSPNLTFRGCGGTGTDVDLRVVDAKGQVAPNITYKVKNKATGAVVAEYAMKDGVNTAIIANMKAGDYTVEWFPQCSPTQLHTDTLRVEDKVKETSRSVHSARCGDDGSIYMYFYSFQNVNAWRFELRRKSDNQLVRTYGSTNGSYANFARIPAGEYIVKATPIVECGELTPAVYEVTVPSEPLQVNNFTQSTIVKNAVPYKNEGAVNYYISYPLDYVKWRVLDVLTGAEINKGEVHPATTNAGGYYIPVTKLPQIYKIEFETPCGKFTRLDSLRVTSRKDMPGFETVIGNGNTSCNQKAFIMVKSRLKTAGFPDKASKIVLYRYKLVNSSWQYVPIDSVQNTSAIIEKHTFTGLDPAPYSIRYYYNGTSEYVQNLNTGEQGQLSISTSYSPFSLKGTSFTTINVQPAEEGKTMRVEVTGNDGSSLLNQVVPADAPYMLQLKKPNTGFTVKVTKIDGCNAGQSVQSYITPSSGAKFNFSAQRNVMKCKNDGEITMIVPDAFRDVDQIHYTLTKTSGTSYTDVAETTTPSVPKTFIGLEAGTYKITGRATVFHDENNQPVVQDFDQTVTLYTPYGEGLYATVRPDYMVPTTTACPNGRIGLNIEKGSGRYRVYLKSTPDGPLAQPQEIFTDASGNNYNKLWGQGLKPGHYSLTVSDGCMERDIPDAEILEMPNTPKYTWYYGYMFLDERIKNNPNDTRDSIRYYIQFDPSLFPQNFRQVAYRAYEVQVVAKGQQPDENQWKSNWSNENSGKGYLDNYAKRFNNCDGFDVLFRLKNCPSSLTRFTDNRLIHNAFSGNWTQLKCNTVQWAFTNGEIGHEYNIKVTRYPDGAVVYNKDKTFHSREEFLQRDPELEFPADKSYRIDMKPKDYCGDPLYNSTTYVNAINRNYQYTLDYGGSIMSDCDGRLLSIKGWTDCRLPMKYFAYEVNGTQETLVAQSGNYVPDAWNSPYKYKKDKTYVIRVVEYGQPETNQVQLVKFTLNYRLPSKYTVYNSYKYSATTFCGSGYNAAKKGYDMNSGYSYYNTSWDGVPAVTQDTYLTIPKMTIVATQKAAPHRKFVATRVTRSNSTLYRNDWRELLPDGSYGADAYAPEGEYSMVAHTDCGDIPMDDDYIGRPTLDLSPTTVDAACDGKFTVTPKGTLTYRGSSSDVEITSFYVSGDNFNTTRNWGQSFDTYQREFTLILNVKRKSDGQTCTLSWPFSMSNYILDFDQSQSLSMFCTDSGKGIIHMALKGGQPPYTYKLSTMDGTEIERKTVPGAVDFEHGVLGQRFRITATDACNLTWIHQDVLLQDPAAISSSMNEKKSYCAGDHVKMAARMFPGATYLWHLPDGSTKAGREIEFNATTASAGLYVVDIHLTTCTVTLTANIRVNIASINEVAGVNLNQQACAGEPVEFTLDPAEAEVNGVAADEDEIAYQWERTATPNDPESWTEIPNATDQNLTYTAAAPGVYYIRRTAMIGECEAISGQSKLTVIPGINVAMTPDEQTVTINNKDPFTLTAGVVTGNPSRTYQWQRSADKKTWVNIGNDETFTETKRFGNTVYYRRIVSAGACSIEGQPITVRFKKRWPAYINPQVRQRALED